MTYQTERIAIERYFRLRWGNRSPIGFDAQPFTPTANSVRLTINSGAVMQGSIGRTANLIEHMGTLTVTIYTEGGKGSALWRDLAETVMGILFNARLTATGAVATGNDCFVRFSPPQASPAEHPYIAASFPSTPFHQTNVIAPFVRYETRSNT